MTKTTTNTNHASESMNDTLVTTTSPSTITVPDCEWELEHWLARETLSMFDFYENNPNFKSAIAVYEDGNRFQRFNVNDPQFWVFLIEKYNRWAHSPYVGDIRQFADVFLDSIVASIEMDLDFFKRMHGSLSIEPQVNQGNEPENHLD